MANESNSRAFSIAALIVGVVLTISGLILFGIYVAGVIDILIDQPADRSWLFWGLGFAFIGIILLVGGIALVVVWRKTRSTRRPGSTSETDG